MIVPDELLTRLNEHPEQLTDADLVLVAKHYGADMRQFAAERRTKALAKTNERLWTIAESQVICKRLADLRAMLPALYAAGYTGDEIIEIIKWAQNPDTISFSSPRPKLRAV